MYPLQSGFEPGSPISLLGTVLLLIVAYLVGRWVRDDANAHGMNGTLWGLVAGVAVFLGLVPGLLVVLVYLVVRD